MDCLACNNKISRGEVLVCVGCKGRYHYKCLNVLPQTSSTVKNNWLCPKCNMVTRRPKGDETPTRRHFEQPATDADMSCDDISSECVGTSTNSSVIAVASMADILQELRAFRSDFSTMNTNIQNVTTAVQELNKKFNDMETRFSTIEDRLIETEKKVCMIPKLKSDLDSARETIAVLESENHRRDQLSRMNNVEISGIPVAAGENLHTLLHTISNMVGCALDERDIDGIMRVRRFEVGDASSAASGPAAGNPRPPAIVVKFTRRIAKDKLLAAVRSRRGLATTDINLPGPKQNIYVSDHLTPRNKLLLKQARQLKSDLGYSYLWIRDCKILMRKNDKSGVTIISSESDLSKLK